MTDSDPQALPFLKAWDNYVAACQTVFERLSEGSAADVGGPMPLAFLGPWKDFAANLGMPAEVATGEHFKPEHMFASFFPALGYSREYQEIARRMLDLTVQFQRRWGEFAQQGVDIGRCALQATKPARAIRRWRGHRPRSTMPGSTAPRSLCTSRAHEPFARLLADICNTLSAFRWNAAKCSKPSRGIWTGRAGLRSTACTVRFET